MTDSIDYRILCLRLLTNDDGERIGIEMDHGHCGCHVVGLHTATIEQFSMQDRFRLFDRFGDLIGVISTEEFMALEADDDDHLIYTRRTI